ncbi:hypothetical protein N8077_05500 [Myxococcota bacterium]|nr:hypothetical protein [Myxococcota bacterium]
MRLLAANFAALSFFSKIGLIFFFDWYATHPIDLFGTYSVAIGLTSAFFVLAGMRGRFLVMNEVQTKSDLIRVNSAVAVLSTAACIVVFAINRESAIIEFIVLISSVKLLENLTDNYTSYLQRFASKDLAFAVVNVRGGLVVVAYLTGIVLDGLLLAVALEMVVGVGILLFQILRSRRLAHSDLSRESRSFGDLVTSGINITLCAALNASLLTLAFYYLTYFQSDTALTLFFAKATAVAAMFSRIASANNFFFRDELRQNIGLFQKLLWVSLAPVALLMIGYAAAMNEWSETWRMWVLGIALVWMMSANIIARQRMMLSGLITQLTVFHALELILLLSAIAVAQPAGFLFLELYVGFQILRSLVLQSLLKMPSL